MEYSNLTLDDFLPRFQLLRPQVNHVALNQRQTAALIPVVRRPQPRLLLTQCSVHLYKHTGQAVFPGGTVDSGDTSSTTTAFRKTQEGVVISPSCVEVIDTLPPADSATGFQIILVTGITPPNLPYRASEDEVSAVFEIPLAQALHLGRYHPLDTCRRGGSCRVWLS